MNNPTKTQPPASPSISTAMGFALMLETACRDFEVCQRLVRCELRIVKADNDGDGMAGPVVQMALAKSFLFHVVRARRICEHGAGSLQINRVERRTFLDATKCVVDVRDVNEHGFDPTNPGRGTVKKPMLHTQADGSGFGDETSLVIFDDKQILMGPLNLYSIYVDVDRMRNLAGFKSMPAPF